MCYFTSYLNKVILLRNSRYLWCVTPTLIICLQNNTNCQFLSVLSIKLNQVCLINQNHLFETTATTNHTDPQFIHKQYFFV